MSEPGTSGRELPWRHGRRRRPSAIRWSSLFFTGVTLATLVGMGALFLVQSLPVWAHAGPDYVLGREWFYRSETFGARSMIYGTLAVAAVAIGVAAPVGIAAAVFTAEVLPAGARRGAKLFVELLAGVPSVVYGLLGVLVLRDWVFAGLRAAGADPLTGDTLLTAGLLLAVMVLPTIMSLADDALRAVPASRRIAARGVGLTRGETILHVSVPGAARGLAAAVLLGLGRAFGETIAVFLVVGRRDNQWPPELFSLAPLAEPGQTLSSKLGGSETSIAYADPLHWAAIVGLGLLLLALVSTLTLLAARLTLRGEPARA